jgi:hypothetical protein
VERYLDSYFDKRGALRGVRQENLQREDSMNKWQRMKLELCYFIDIVLVVDYYTGGGGLRVPSTQSLNLLGMGNP